MTIMNMKSILIAGTLALTAACRAHQSHQSLTAQRSRAERIHLLSPLNWSDLIPPLCPVRTRGVPDLCAMGAQADFGLAGNVPLAGVV